MGVAMRIGLKDGRRIEGNLDAFRGTPEQPFTRADAKARSSTTSPAASTPPSASACFQR